MVSKLEYSSDSEWKFIASENFVTDAILVSNALNKSYVDSHTWMPSAITGFDTQVRLSRLDQMAIPAASLNLNSQKITSLAIPSLSTDAATKGYVDTHTWVSSQITDLSTTIANKSLSLTGVVTGSGTLGSGISASFASNPVFPGTASMTIPIGTTAQRPSTAVFGMMRANSTLTAMEMYTGASWLSFNTSNATVSSIGITAGTGLSVSGSPVTSSGNITVGLSNTSVTAGTYTYISSLTTNAQGQITGISSGSAPTVGTVTSVACTGSTGLSVSGSPVTTSGTLALTLGTELQALSGLNTLGIVCRTAANTYVPRNIAVGAGLSITNPAGTAGNPTLSLGTIPIANLSGYPGTTTTFLRGDGTWIAPVLSFLSGSLSASQISGYPTSSNAFLRGDGSWMLPTLNSLPCTGNVNIGSYNFTGLNLLASTAVYTNNIYPFSGSYLNFNANLEAGNYYLATRNKLYTPSIVSSQTGYVSFDDATAIKVPLGTTAQQPGQSGQIAAVTGMLRHNTTSSVLEYYSGQWQTVTTSHLPMLSYPKLASLSIGGDTSLMFPSTYFKMLTTDGSSVMTAVQFYSSEIIPDVGSTFTFSHFGNNIFSINTSSEVLSFNQKTAISLPTGLTTDRPTAYFGRIRANSTTGYLEYADNSATPVWKSLYPIGENLTAGYITVNTIYATSMGYVNFGNTSAIKVPSGTTAERPGSSGQISPVAGMIRYNTTTNDLEYYDSSFGGSWSSIAERQKSWQVQTSSSYTGGDDFTILPLGGRYGTYYSVSNNSSESRMSTGRGGLYFATMSANVAKSTYDNISSAIWETTAGGESSAIAQNGNFMQFINPMDTLGFIFTDEDNVSMTSYVAYINGSGQFIPCSREKKHSILKKEPKDYLERLNRLNVYSYGLKYDILKSDSPKKKARKQRKMNELQVGVIAEEVLELFDNATNVYKPLDASQETLPSHTPSLAVNYNTLLCYTILAVQELTQRLIALEQKAHQIH